jgi:hypothetical protein
MLCRAAPRVEANGPLRRERSEQRAATPMTADRGATMKTHLFRNIARRQHLVVVFVTTQSRLRGRTSPIRRGRRLLPLLSQLRKGKVPRGRLGIQIRTQPLKDDEAKEFGLVSLGPGSVPPPSNDAQLMQRS